jgi:5-methylcytosine-specific restriction endonuclease McrA
MPVRPCLGHPGKPRCPKYALKGQSRCEGCLQAIRPLLTGARGTSPEWSRARKKALERDKHRCRICESTLELEVHHLDRDARNNDLMNLVTLCGVHHKEAHKPAHNPRDWHFGQVHGLTNRRFIR